MNGVEFEGLGFHVSVQGPGWFSNAVEGIRRTLEAREVQEAQYGVENGVSRFDIFLKRSNQKQNLARWLARQFKETKGNQPLEVLDIGTSRGTLLNRMVGQLIDAKVRNPIHFHLIEPDQPSLRSLRVVASAIAEFSNNVYQATINATTWQEFDPARYAVKEFDAIICAHVIYYFNPAEFQQLFSKMVRLLKPGGRLFVIARSRQQDEVYRFLQTFLTPATGKPFAEITIEDAIPALEQIVQADPTLQMAPLDYSKARVELPFNTDLIDAQYLVGFFFQQPWHQIPQDVQRQIWQRFNGQDAELRQFDGIVTVRRVNNVVSSSITPESVGV